MGVVVPCARACVDLVVVYGCVVVVYGVWVCGSGDWCGGAMVCIFFLHLHTGVACGVWVSG